MKILLMFWLVCAVTQAQAEGVSLRKLTDTVSGQQPAASSDLPVADFDGDGRPDLAIPAENADATIIKIVGNSASDGWALRQSFLVQNSGSGNWPIALAAATDRNGVSLVVARSRSILVYSHWPLRVVRRFDLADEAHQVKVADVDGDGRLEIVSLSTRSNGVLQVLDFQTGTVKWRQEGFEFGASLGLAQLDRDPALEILVNGFAIDGATRAIDWDFGVDFGYALAFGKFGGSSPRFASLSSSVRMFQASPWLTLWEVAMWGSEARTVAVADLDGDGIDELIAVEHLSSRVDVFDVATRSIRRSYTAGRTNLVAVGDFDGDGAMELAFVIDPDFYPISTIALRVIDAATGAVEFEELAMRPGGYEAALVILDGAFKVVQSSGSYDRAPQLPGLVRMSDVATKAPGWMTPAFTYPNVMADISAKDIHSIRLARYAKPVVVVLGRRGIRRVMFALDSADGSVLWVREQTASPASHFFSASLPVDKDGDGITDSIYACTDEQHILEFRLTDGALLWDSGPLAMTSCSHLFLAPSARGTSIVGVFWLGLKAYDTRTGALDWSFSTLGLDGGAYVPNGANGPEIVVIDLPAGGLVFRDSATREVLRSVRLTGRNFAVVQPEGASIRNLLVAGEGRLKVVDGISGVEQAVTDSMGTTSRTIDSIRLADDHHIIAMGGSTGAFVYELRIPKDQLFADGVDGKN